MRNNKSILALGLMLGALAPAAFAAPAVIDTDGDGVPDFVERWLQRQGAPVSPTVFNAYNDADGDGIPDLVETYVTQTNPAVSDTAVCAGGGGPVDITGQYDVRVATNLANPVNFLTDDLIAVSICHTAGGGVKVYNSRWGYANSASLTGTGPYTFTATWLNGNTATGTCSSPCSTITGTANIGAGVKQASATRRMVLTGGTAAAGSGLYGIQLTGIPKPASPSPHNPEHLGSEAVQISIDPLSKARLFHKGLYDTLPGYYVASVGTAFFVQYDHYEDPGSSYMEDIYGVIGLTVTEAPVAGVGGMVRGGSYNIEDSSLPSTGTSEDQAYGKAQLPLTYGLTMNRTIGLRSQLTLNNVPVSADVATVSGPGLTTSTIFDHTDDNQNDSVTWFNNKDWVVNHRLRIPGFTNGESVGLSGNGNDINISNINYNHTGVLPSFTYTFNFTGAVGGFSSANVGHINYSSTPLPVITGVALDAAPLTAGRPNGTQGLDTTVAHNLTWNPVTTGGIAGNGVGSAGVYRLIVTDSYGNQINGQTDPDSLNRFISPSQAGCQGGGTCTMTLVANTLPLDGAYRFVIEARDHTDSNNRSRTDRYYLNTPRYKVADFSADGTADIVWRHGATGNNVLWHMGGTTVLDTGVIGGDTNWTPLRFYGDFNDDGFTDMLWRHNTSGVVSLYTMLSYYSREGQFLGGDTDWSIVRIGDFNGDGYRDLIWRQASTGATVMWLMREFEVYQSHYLGGDLTWQVVQTGDFNGDRKADILWRNSSTGAVVMWLMDGATVTSAGLVGGDLNWSIVANGDFNGDGKRDLLWRHGTTGLTVMWLMDGFAATAAAAIGGDTTWSVRKVGDYSGDGKWDILWRNGTNGLTVMWLMNGLSVVGDQAIGGDLNWTVH